MEDILKAIKRDLRYKNYYSALFLTVMLPSICGALQSQNGKDSPKKYIQWFDKYIDDLFIKGKDCYLLRCSLIHQGKTSHKNSSFSGFRFYLSF